MKKLLMVLAIVIPLLQISCSTDSVSNPSASERVDVYIAGSKNGQACYWKNNQLVLLNSGSFTSYSATKIIVSNTDVYVLGYGLIENSSAHSLVWKNGVVTDLRVALGDAGHFASVVDIQVVGNDVYYVGYSYTSPLDTNNPSKLVYWKNNVMTVVTDFPNFAFSEARIKVVNNDVCILASNNHSTQIQGYFLNGAYTAIPGSSSYNLTNNNGQIYIYGENAMNGFYYNTSSSINTILTTSNGTGINHMAFDNDNLYYSDGEKIFRNGTIVYSENFPTNNIFDFRALNNNLFVISGGNDVNNMNEELRINGITTLTAAEGENFASLFLVQN